VSGAPAGPESGPAGGPAGGLTVTTLPSLRPDPGAAPVARRVLAQARFDVTAMLRNGEQLLLTLVLPLLALVGLARTSAIDLGDGRQIDLAAPGVLALAVMSTAFTGQAIATGFDRRAGLLRLLGVTPLGRSGLLAGRVVAVLAVEALQVVVLGGVALGLGWRPRGAGLLPALVTLLLGTAAFVALGLLLAGTLRAEAVLAAANLVWVLLLAGGGVVVPPEKLGALSGVATALPSGALGEAMRASLAGGRWPVSEWLVLTAWLAAAALATSRWFKWT
jgi:ABC-2 type transport system permease protein